MSQKEDKQQAKAKVENTYISTITFKCPKRGLVTQKVVVKKYTAQRPSDQQSVDSDVQELLQQYDDLREDAED